MMYEQHVSTVGGELEWYPEPNSRTGRLKGHSAMSTVSEWHIKEPLKMELV